MARKCPNCFAAAPRTKLLVYSNNFECPSCQSPLEISGWSRNISAFVGLIVAALVWKVSSAHYALHPGALGWLFPVLFSYLAYSIAAPLVLISTGDLRFPPSESAPGAAESSPAHLFPH
jgi:hypothetical protein